MSNIANLKKLEEDDFDIFGKNYSKNITSTNKFEYMPKIYTIKFWHEFDHDSSLYNSYFELLEKAREEDTIIFYFNSPGGSVTTLNLFINALRRCKSKTIIARVNYAASAAALLALFCDNIEFDTNATLMLHDFYTVEHGKSQNIEASFNHTKKEIHGLMKLICKKVLSEEEIKDMLNGKDFYFNGEEVIIRLKKYANKLMKELEQKKNSKSKTGKK